VRFTLAPNAFIYIETHFAEEELPANAKRPIGVN
jgi:hypothetical protein